MPVVSSDWRRRTWTSGCIQWQWTKLTLHVIPFPSHIWPTFWSIWASPYWHYRYGLFLGIALSAGQVYSSVTISLLWIIWKQQPSFEPFLQIGFSPSASSLVKSNESKVQFSEGDRMQSVYEEVPEFCLCLKFFIVFRIYWHSGSFSRIADESLGWILPSHERSVLCTCAARSGCKSFEGSF